LSETNIAEKSQEVTHFLTIKEAIPRYFNYCDKIAKNCQQEISNKFYLIKRFFDWCDSHNYEFIMLSDITEQAVLRFFDDLVEKEGNSGKTFNNSLGRLRNFYNIALKRKWVEGTSPFKLIEKQRVGYGEKSRAFSDCQLNFLIPYLEENEEYLHKFIGFIYYALMRPSEIKRLKIKNIDMTSRLIRFEAEQSKVKRLDILPIADGLYDFLKTMNLENQNPDHYLFSSKRKPSEFPMSRGWTTERFKKVKDKFNLDSNYSIYGFKHTAVCKWYEQTKDIVRVQRMCRHSSIDMTARYLKSLGVMGDQYKIDSLPNLI
jgi:integrase